jgi:hypothetical protein
LAVIPLLTISGCKKSQPGHDVAQQGAGNTPSETASAESASSEQSKAAVDNPTGADSDTQVKAAHKDAHSQSTGADSKSPAGAQSFSATGAAGAQKSGHADDLATITGKAPLVQTAPAGANSNSQPVATGTVSPGHFANVTLPAGGAANVNAGDSSVVQAAAVPEGPKPTCFAETFHHKNLPGHNSDEACSHHRNVISLKHTDANVASLCVRVNGTPVKFEKVKGHRDQVMIGHIAGPNAKIVATYCVGKNRCDEECKIPKDEFMDAIGGSDEENAVVGHWDSADAGDSALNDKLKKELASLDETAPTVSSSVFKDWIEDSEVPACGFKAASSGSEDVKAGAQVATQGR